MALPVYIELEGKKQGKIDGGGARKGREKMIEATAVRHTVHVPTDTHTGQITGNRIHGPFTFVKEIDKASPPLQQAMVTGEVLTTFTAHFWRVAPDGKETEFYKIELEEAQISSITTILPDTHREGQLKPQEEVAVRYTTITWTYLDGNLVATDSWLSPVS